MKAIVKSLYIAAAHKATASYWPGHSKMVDVGPELVAAEVEFSEPVQVHTTAQYYGMSRRQPAKKIHILAAKGMYVEKDGVREIHVDELQSQGSKTSIKISINKEIEYQVDDENRYLIFASFNVSESLKLVDSN